VDELRSELAEAASIEVEDRDGWRAVDPADKSWCAVGVLDGLLPDEIG
jgi:hypothetical protein